MSSAVETSLSIVPNDNQIAEKRNFLDFARQTARLLGGDLRAALEMTRWRRQFVQPGAAVTAHALVSASSIVPLNFGSSRSTPKFSE